MAAAATILTIGSDSAVYLCRGLDILSGKFSITIIRLPYCPCRHSKFDLGLVRTTALLPVSGDGKCENQWQFAAISRTVFIQWQSIRLLPSFPFDGEEGLVISVTQ